jgi:hypothetical protein
MEPGDHDLVASWERGRCADDIFTRLDLQWTWEEGEGAGKEASIFNMERVLWLVIWIKMFICK